MKFFRQWAGVIASLVLAFFTKDLRKVSLLLANGASASANARALA